MSVTTPAGFEASGVSCGLKSSAAKDLALLVNRGPRNAAAAVFTTNRCQANPVLWSQQVVADGRVSAVILNSGGANCYTGAFGFQTTHATAESVAKLLGFSASDVVVCSTGLIGVGGQPFRDALLGGIPAAASALSPDGGSAAALAIMTTDTRAKEAVFVSPDGWSLGAMAKGAGMLAPGLATMLVAITTDADCDSHTLDRALRSATRVTFDRLDSDGCMSTNDTVVVLASGASGVTPTEAEFTEALSRVCADLARQLQDDAEGANHNIAITVTQAATEDDAVEVARAISRSNLFKTAIFGNDPNWGRILAAVGTTQAVFDPYHLDVVINGVMVCKAGEASASRDLVDLSERSVSVLVDLHSGTAEATILTNDLTHHYIHENSAYSS